MAVKGFFASRKSSDPFAAMPKAFCQGGKILVQHKFGGASTGHALSVADEPIVQPSDPLAAAYASCSVISNAVVSYLLIPAKGFCPWHCLLTPALASVHHVLEIACHLVDAIT